MPLDLASEIASVALRILFLALLYYFVYRVARLLVTSTWASRRQEVPAASLVVVDPGASSLRPGLELPAAAVTSLGRDPSNTVVIDDPTVSGEHAILLWNRNRWWISDLGSTSGTTINGIPVTGPAKVEFGDTIGISAVKLKLSPTKRGLHKGAG